MTATKIATCCYCGTKAALVLRGRDKHELSCASCGAPLKTLKMLPVSATQAPDHGRTPVGRHSGSRVERYVPRPKKRRKTKGFGRRAVSGLWDLIEDVVDEVFD